jgi:hypothetical protein
MPLRYWCPLLMILANILADPKHHCTGCQIGTSGFLAIEYPEEWVQRKNANYHQEP